MESEWEQTPRPGFEPESSDRKSEMIDLKSQILGL